MPDAMRPSYGDQENDHGRLVAFPAGDRPASPPSNLPLQLSSFVGREKELSEVRRLLQDTRLLTLTGPGGCGKTRLAVVAASDPRQEFEDGVRMVELAPLSGPTFVPQAVASVLGAREQPDISLTETLSNHLRNKNMLLVLDNCEHLIEACAELVETLLRSCLRLRILATSREALAVPGEAAWPVPSLTLPDLRRLPDVDSLSRYESARLFLDRTTSVDPTFALEEQEAAAVARVCYRLDGIPLAIELAAARTRVLSVKEISEKLDHSFGLLTSGGRTAMPRHRTLRATMDWSYDLLTGVQQTLFLRLSVFAGGFTLKAAESVCAGEELERGEVLEVLSYLVDKSLVMVQRDGGETRYHLLEMVRQYGREKLLDADNEIRRRHAAFFLGLAEEAEHELAGPDQARWLTALDTEHDNIRAALSWSLAENGDTGSGMRFAAALWPYWFARGYLSEGRRWLEDALSRTDSAPGLARARALNGAGSLATFQEDYGTAKILIQEGLALSRALGDKESIAASLANLCGVAMLGQRDDIPVMETLGEALVLKPELKDRRTVGNLFILEGRVALARGDLERSVTLGEEGLSLYREARDDYGIIMCLLHIGFVTLRQGEFDRTTNALQEGLRLSEKLDHKVFVQYCLTALAAVAASRGQPVRAARLWGAEEGMSETFGGRIVREGRATIDYEGRLATARLQLDEATWAAAWAEGRTMSPEKATEYALEQELSPEPIAQDAHPAGLSSREIEILRLVATGLSNAEVAKELFLSSRTVDWHLGSVYRKLGIHTRTEATRFALEHDLL